MSDISNVNLGELFAAMALARLEFGTFTKSKTATIKSDKGSYGYNYADLSDIIEATAGALAKHGLVIIQEPEVTSDGSRQTVVISGCIAHKSGGIYPLRPLSLPVVGNTAQAVGSAVSYARRYQLSAILNLAATDDDAQAADNGPASTQKPVDVAFDAPAMQLATREQLKRLGDLGAQYYGAEWAEQLPKLVEAVTKGATSDVSQLQPAEATKLIAGIEKKLAQAEVVVK